MKVATSGFDDSSRPLKAGIRAGSASSMEQEEEEEEENEKEDNDDDDDTAMTLMMVNVEKILAGS